MNDYAQFSRKVGSAQQSTRARLLDALEPYSLNKEGSSQYRCNSPLRPGSDSHAFVLTLDEDGEHGAYYDHVSGDQGSLYELADKLGIEYPTQGTEVPDTKRTYTSRADYAETHGVPESVFEAAGWSEVTKNGRPALEFTTQRGKRWRFLDGDKPTYLSEKGYSKCWYGLKTAIKRANSTGQPLVLCNGEASTVVAAHFGLAACCITSGEIAHIPDALLAALKAYTGPVVIAYDCDAKGRDAARGLRSQLLAAGFKVRALDLGLSKGGDLADLCRLHGENVLTALQRLPDLPDPEPRATDAALADKPDLLDAARSWAKSHSDTWAYDADLGTWRRWTGTHWQAQTQRGPIDMQAADVLRALAIPISSPGKLDGVIRLAEALCSRAFAPTPTLVNFQNGTLDLTTMQLRAHDRADALIYCLPYPYSPGAYPAIDNALRSIIPDELARAAYMVHLGLALMNDLTFHKALLLYGPKRSGKSTLLDLALVTCGQERGEYADKWLFDGGVDGMWARARYHDQRLVGIDELPDSALQAEGEDNFKKMTAHGGVSMRYMRQMQTTANRWTPKLLMTTNDAPRYRDSSGALTERFLILRCPNSRSDAEQDRKLFDSKLRPEVPQFAAACLSLALNAIKAGLYPESEAMRRLRELIENQGDSVKTWVAERGTFEPGVFTGTDLLYVDYKDWCLDNGQTPMSKPRFSQALTDRYQQLSTGRKRQYISPGVTQQVRGLIGLRLRLPADDELDTEGVTHVTHCDEPLPGCVTPQEMADSARIEGSSDTVTQESQVAGSTDPKVVQENCATFDIYQTEKAKNASHASHPCHEGASADAKPGVTHDETPDTPSSQPTSPAQSIVPTSPSSTLPADLTGAEAEALRVLADRTKGAPAEYVNINRVFTGVSPITYARCEALPDLRSKGYIERQKGSHMNYRLTVQGWAALGFTIHHVDLSTF